MSNIIKLPYLHDPTKYHLVNKAALSKAINKTFAKLFTNCGDNTKKVELHFSKLMLVIIANYNAEKINFLMWRYGDKPNSADIAIAIIGYNLKYKEYSYRQGLDTLQELFAEYDLLFRLMG